VQTVKEITEDVKKTPKKAKRLHVTTAAGLIVSPIFSVIYEPHRKSGLSPDPSANGVNRRDSMTSNGTFLAPLGPADFQANNAYADILNK
jgi:hypothetical protein